MSLYDRVEELKTHLSKEHQDIAQYVEHTLKAIEQVEEHHRKLMAMNAIGGSKINGETEQMFYNTTSELKKQLVETLEKTVEDFEHKGDKNWEKNFRDGVE